MGGWYKSGIEAFCKVAADKVDLSPDLDGWRPIVTALLGGDRSATERKDKMSKLWRLSSHRRVKEFESHWAQVDTPSLKLPDDPLLACVDAIMAANRIEERCDVEAKASSGADRERFADLEEIAGDQNFVRDCFIRSSRGDLSAMAGAIAQGLVTEGYSESDVRFFLAGVDAKLEGWRESDEFARSIMRMYIAAIIYGPTHPAALIESDLDTMSAEDCGGFADTQGDSGPDFGGTVVFTQLHGNGFVFAGDRESVAKGTVLFFGRKPSLDEYRSRFDKILAENGIDLFSETGCHAFSIPHACMQVSSYHAAVFHLNAYDFGGYRDCGWYCVDLGSKNGTTVIDAAGSRSANVPISIKPGSRIVMGGDPEDPCNAVIVASIPFRES